MILKGWITVLLLGIILFEGFDYGNGQRNIPRRKPKPKKNPSAGKWVPLRQRLAAEAKRKKNGNKKNGPKRNKVNSNAKFFAGGVQFDNLIQPPLLRSPNEADLQDPSWSHCLHNVQIDQNWASISSPNFPRPIAGQLQCTWMFEGMRGMRLQLSFNVLDLQEGSGDRCGNQFIDLIDMELLKSQGRFCGSRVPGDYVSVGRKLRLDIQGDTTVTPHKGFQAAVRSIPYIVQPGLRQRSTLFHGASTIAATTTRRPVTRRPPVASKRRTKPTTTPPTTTITVRELLFGQMIYGPDRQPPKAEIITYSKDQSGVKTTIILYSFIGLFCLLVLLSGIAFVFRKQLYAKYKERKRKKKMKKERKKKKKTENNSTEDEESKDESGDEVERGKVRGQENKAFSNGRFEIPESAPATPSLPNSRRRKSVVFEDEVSSGDVREPVNRNQSSDDLKNGYESDMFKSQESLPSLGNDISTNNRFQGWNYPQSEPVYEDDAFTQSFEPPTHRTPDYSSLRQKKIIEGNRALKENEDVYAPLSEPIYHVGGPMGPGPPFNMPPPYYSGYGVPYHDQRSQYSIHPQMMRHESLTRGRPDVPPMYSRSRRESRSDNAPPIYDAYHQGRVPVQQQSKDDINLHKQQMGDSNVNLNGIKPAKSVGDLSMAGSEWDSNLKSTQSMAALPLTTDSFPRSKMQRSHSFSM